jgi:hypothetical protein
VGSHEWRGYRSARNVFTVEDGTVLDGEMNETAVTGLTFSDPASAYFVWVKVTYDPQDLTITSAIMQSGAEKPEDTDTVRHIEVVRLLNAYENGRWWSIVFQTRSEPIQMFAGGANGPFHDWKVVMGAQTDGEGNKEWLVTGGTVYHEEDSTAVADTAVNINSGIIYLEITRDYASREVTGITVESGTSIPAADYNTQHVPIARVNVAATPTERVRQDQFGELRINEFMGVANGEFRMATTNMAARNTYAPSV